MLFTAHTAIEIVVCGASTAQVDGQGNNDFHRKVIVGRDDYYGNVRKIHR